MAKEFGIGAQSEGYAKITLNDRNECIYIDENDTSVMNRVSDFVAWLESTEVELEKKARENAARYDNAVKYDEDGEIEDIDISTFSEVIKLQTELYREIVARIDDIFGEGTMKKYFYRSYEINPGFVPDDESLSDFLDQIIPVLNEIYADKKHRIEMKYNSGRRGAKSGRYRSKAELIEDYKNGR